METENKHCADGDQGDDAAFDVVERFCQVYEGVYRYEVNHIVQCDVEDEIVLVDVPVEQDEAGKQGSGADC